MSSHPGKSVALPRLVVLASTYPRWQGDPEPGFVHELSKRLTSSFQVIAIVPHAKGARAHETLDDVDVFRYRYAPAPLERLVNDGGILANLRNARWKWLLLPGFFLGSLFKTWKLIRAMKPDVIHVHWLVPQGLVVALISSFHKDCPPFVVTSHGADLFALRGRLMIMLKRWVANRAAAVTVVSAAMVDEVRRIGADLVRVDVLPMGVDLSERFTPDASVNRAAREILFVGRLVEKKGVEHLLSAMPAVLSALPDASLTIAGFGPEEARLKAQIEALGVTEHVRFLGPVSQERLPDLYRRAAVFVAPFVQAASGDQEGLGLVVVEALGCGCPIVMSDLPATRDIGPSGSGMIRVPPGDVPSLAEAIISTINVGPKQCAVDVSQFSWITRAAAYSQLLMSVSVAGKRHG